MNSVLSLVGAGGVMAVCAAAYLTFLGEEATPSPPGVAASAPAARVITAATDPAPRAPLQEIHRGPATVTARPQKDAADERLATLSAKVQRLEERLDALDQAVQQGRAALPVAGQDARFEAAEPEHPGADPHAVAETEAQEHARAQRLEADFWNEPPSHSPWSSHAATAVQNALASVQSGAIQVNSLECRGRQCRVELLLYDEVSTTTVMDALPGYLAEVLPTIMIHPAGRHNGTTSLVLYLFGEGYPSPPGRD